MPRYGYARVSTLDQDLSIQRAALQANLAQWPWPPCSGA
jgi:DNA invertase Pin-like site-specific DNA recombinase